MFDALLLVPSTLVCHPPTMDEEEVARLACHLVADIVDELHVKTSKRNGQILNAERDFFNIHVQRNQSKHDEVARKDGENIDQGDDISEWADSAGVEALNTLNLSPSERTSLAVKHKISTMVYDHTDRIDAKHKNQDSGLVREGPADQSIIPLLLG